jgi:hypothetical protein
MPNTCDHTIPQPVCSPPMIERDEWESEVLARLPEGWQEQAEQLKAFRRTRAIKNPGDLLRGLLAYVLQGFSLRRAGCVECAGGSG